MDDLNAQGNNQFQGKNKKLSTAKIIFIILGLILFAEVVYAVKVLSSPTPPTPPISKTVVRPAISSISLNSPGINYKVKEVIPVSVMVDTGSHTIDGIDLIVKFDPKTLEATPGGLIRGQILDEYPLIALDADKGVISISGVNNTNEGFKGVGQFALINFKAKVSGQTALVIDFQKNLTTDSNLVESGTSKDILEQAYNLNLVIQ